jgi:hypothetical protein
VIPALVLAPVAAFAAGLEVPENGALMLGRGGTAVSLPGSSYSVQFNPAGMSDIEEFDAHIDTRFVRHDVSFTRAPRIERERGIDYTFATVSNQAGVFIAPNITAAHRFPNSRLAFGVGLWGPPGVGAYQYPDPAKLFAAGEPAEETGLLTPQRYSVIRSESSILFPSMGLSWKFSDEFSLGITGSAIRANVGLRQAIAARSTGGLESATGDGIATLDLLDPFTPTFLLGAQWTPMPGLRFGFSFRPTIDIEARGTLKFETLLGASDSVKFSGDRARMSLTLPSMARAGATFDVGPWMVSLEMVYEGWSANRRLLLEGENIEITISGRTEALKPFIIRKDWRDAIGLRVGASLPLLDEGPQGWGVTLHTGALVETNAVPEWRQNIDTVSSDRASFSGGLTARWGGLALTLSGMGYVPVTMVVTRSEQKRGVAGAPDVPPVTVGNGIYQSSIWIGSIGLAYTGFGRAG